MHGRGFVRCQHWGTHFSRLTRLLLFLHRIVPLFQGCVSIHKNFHKIIIKRIFSHFVSIFRFCSHFLFPFSFLCGVRGGSPNYGGPRIVRFFVHLLVLAAILATLLHI